MRTLALILALCVSGPMLGARALQYTPDPGTELLHRPLDQILDINVRDGLVYYRALKSERGRLDRYIVSLNVPAATYQSWSKVRQMAFWVDTYNAVILQTVINHYPIRSRSTSYPANSIRQIPGYEQAAFRAAGRAVTLEQIEKTILPEFKEPRLYLALGRGAVGSGRLRSEAYTGDRLEKQLANLQQEFVTDRQMVRIDRMTNQMSITPILSWREREFVAAYDKADPAFAERSPIERAILTFLKPGLLPLEKEFVQQNAFKVVFHEFDWRLNDLTGGRIE
ncbi:MAG: hypothetical protein DMF84_18420 [Acidobacteria bacterium]|nr:MAG: hypothetical protein DMF84_18420 [Acidobacteriota bacterium]